MKGADAVETLWLVHQRARQAPSAPDAPLAVRMRPASLDEYVGQQKAVGPDSWLRRAIERDVLSSVILYGPAGTGKTTLAHIIAAHTRSEFVEVSAVTGTVKDLRREIEEAQRRLMAFDRRTILFIDEIHRFSRSQQDALLHAVENRTVVMIGATTENPYFEVNSALLSRSRVVELEPLSDEDIAVARSPRRRGRARPGGRLRARRRRGRGRLHPGGRRCAQRAHHPRARERVRADPSRVGRPRRGGGAGPHHRRGRAHRQPPPRPALR